MTDIIANDGKRLWRLIQQTEPFAETGWRSSSQARGLPKVRNSLPDYSERRTATASWQRSILIIGALSTLCWAAVILFVIELLSAF
jgi:hypothetical protein